MNKTIDKDTIKKLNLHLGEAMDTGYAKLHFNEISNLIDLYERQEIEIQRLIEEVKAEYGATFLAKIEVIKEFAEKYEKVLLSMLTTATLEKKEVIYSCLDTLDTLEEEMVGKNNNE
jgi:hypothetical protein